MLVAYVLSVILLAAAFICGSSRRPSVLKYYVPTFVLFCITWLIAGFAMGVF